MARIALIAQAGNIWARALLESLRRARPTLEYNLAEPVGFCREAAEQDSELSCVYTPSLTDKEGVMPDLSEAERVFQQSAGVRPSKFILLSSAIIYGTGPARKSLVTEDYSGRSFGTDRICRRWKSLEAAAARHLKANVPLVILRPATVLPSPVFLSRRLMRQLIVTLPGHDPVLQLLSLGDLAEAVLCAVERGRPGAFNVAPDGVIPLSAAALIARSHRVPLPRTLQRVTVDSAALEYLRYPWTISNTKIRMELGFAPHKSSAAALMECRNLREPTSSAELTFDEFGMDADYIRFFSNTLFKFLCDFYWRIETRGLEHIPRQGPGVLVGMHRGFMPWDGVMALHQLVQNTGRIPRFLTHPGLLKFPFICNFVRKLGGVVACRESADRVLEGGELLGVFPEGVHAAFLPYRKAYRLQSFGRDDFVKMALRHRAPIVPFVTVGSAEILPVLWQVKPRWWTRYSGWPCLPISTFPFLPLPLPSKWHTRFLPPIHTEEQYPPETALDASVVKAISLEVRTKMQEAVDEMLRRRRSIFFGPIFKPEGG
ncbi:MAG TPA: 1-acyl-sn-glycerol-3-phosphate acyltransferase [Candidatus Acidoferrales bacterium]|nr:1-acyl-sn-glycerol-3-phosphate acyltransferase [Candidatus Acidoferrales bacterium]